MSAHNKQIHNERGALGPEVAITIGMFLMVIGMGIELMRYAYYGLALQFVVNEAARFSSIGAGCQNGCSEQQRSLNIEQRMQRNAANFGLVLDISKNICILADAAGRCATDSNGDYTDAKQAGLPNQLVVVRASVPFDFFFGVGSLRANALAIARNEPFEAS